MTTFLYTLQWTCYHWQLRSDCTHGEETALLPPFPGVQCSQGTPCLTCKDIVYSSALTQDSGYRKSRQGYLHPHCLELCRTAIWCRTVCFFLGNVVCPSLQGTRQLVNTRLSLSKIGWVSMCRNTGEQCITGRYPLATNLIVIATQEFIKVLNFP